MTITRINLGDTGAKSVEGEVVAALEITDEGDIKLYIDDESHLGLKSVVEVMRLLVVQLDARLAEVGDPHDN
jgi:hypothetical protein